MNLIIMNIIDIRSNNIKNSKINGHSLDGRDLAYIKNWSWNRLNKVNCSHRHDRKLNAFIRFINSELVFNICLLHNNLQELLEYVDQSILKQLVVSSWIIRNISYTKHEALYHLIVLFNFFYIVVVDNQQVLVNIAQFTCYFFFVSVYFIFVIINSSYFIFFTEDWVNYEFLKKFYLF